MKKENIANIVENVGVNKRTLTDPSWNSATEY